ncbi:hypothetical protein [Mucilaginibacter gossypii]|nr:hypothetical protein DIU36_20100 [Mucilaginibacter rubeus]
MCGFSAPLSSCALSPNPIHFVHTLCKSCIKYCLKKKHRNSRCVCL